MLVEKYRFTNTCPDVIISMGNVTPSTIDNSLKKEVFIDEDGFPMVKLTSRNGAVEVYKGSRSVHGLCVKSVGNSLIWDNVCVSLPTELVYQSAYEYQKPLTDFIDI